jgi:hypothetical protein
MMIERSMKRDGRTFDHQTLEAIRMMSIERVRQGESPADVMGAASAEYLNELRCLSRE